MEKDYIMYEKPNEYQIEIYEYYKIHGIKQTCDKYGVSKKRVYGISKKIEIYNKREQLMGEFYGLSVQTYNALMRNKVEKTRKKLKELYINDDLRKLRNFGERRIEDVRIFLGL